MSTKRRIPLRSWITVALVGAVAGLMFGVSASNARLHGSAAQGNLASLVREQQDVVVSLQNSVEELQVEQENAVAAAHPAEAESGQPLLQARGELSGPGVKVTLDDAPTDFVLDESVNVNAAVVHQQDVDAVMNALWQGGAEAMSVQGVRITSTTPVRCVGNVILVGARSYAPPYEIAAIGDQSAMVEALENDPIVALYRRDAARYQLGWSVQLKESIVVPAAPDLSPLNYATLMEGSA